ncbi:MAG TPA: class I SAM-dependent methyltransferase [Saprospiraceae bacterium]|nr:class I SAM-dependent methyltransferase [Saprospiraceae bacterium]HQW54974.1 class I SAM-dependent methyltransferase [Saprospiraceae bacterium]
MCVLAFALILGCKGDTTSSTETNSFRKENKPDSTDDIILSERADSMLLSSDNGPERVIWQKPELVVNLLGDLKNQTVADIGAGTGFFTFRLLQKADKVIASDIDTASLHLMQILSMKLDTAISDRLKIVIAKADDPNLGKDKVDVAFISNTYMYLTNRGKYLQNLKLYLKPNARLMIIDYKKKNLPFGPQASQKIDLSQVENELTDAGFKILLSDDISLDYQYIVIATIK